MGGPDRWTEAEAISAWNTRAVAPEVVALAETFELLERLRNDGWNVAVHNDYLWNSISYTFWLLTNKATGQFVKGEAHTDKEALEKCAALALAGGGGDG